MSEIDYASAPIKVRDDITEAHRRAWQRLAEPGTWWTGKERVAIAEEVRSARKCALCRERKAALSPNAVEGKHDSPGVLPEEVVDVIHRVVTDPGGGSARSGTSRSLPEGSRTPITWRSSAWSSRW